MDIGQPNLRASPEASLLVLLAMKGRLLRNNVATALQQHHWRIVVGAGVVGVLCTAMYVMLFAVFAWLQKRHLESVVAVEYIFHFFFIAVMAMLWLSSTLLNYAGLFGRDEPEYLLVAPIQTWHFVSIKFVEAFVLSSWSLLLLGAPLLAAMARVYTLDVQFFPLFAAAFIALAIIPSAWGLLTAYAVARWVPRKTVTLLIVTTGLMLAVAMGIGMYRWMTAGHATEANWLKEFYGRLRIARGTFLPSTWMSRLTLLAGQGQYREALFYLAVLAANALFFVWLAIKVVAWDFGTALMRASEGSAKRVRLRGHLTAALANVAFFWLSPRLRGDDPQGPAVLPARCEPVVADGRAGVLLALYVMNLPRLNVRVLANMRRSWCRC